jgi:hypothetical protein
MKMTKKRKLIVKMMIINKIKKIQTQRKRIKKIQTQRIEKNKA